MRGITLRGLRSLVTTIKDLVQSGQFRKLISNHPVVVLGEVVTSYSELTTTDIVYR